MRAVFGVKSDLALDELNRVTLQRIIWFLAVILLINSVLLLLHSVVPPDVFPAANGPWFVDFLVSPGLLAVSAALRRSRVSLAWRQAFVLFFLILQLTITGYYYFSLLPAVGPTNIYVFNLLSLGVVLLISPGLFFAILLANHVHYCFFIWQADLEALPRSAALIDGSIGLGLATLCQFLVYAGKCNDIRRRDYLAQQVEAMNVVMTIAAHDLRSPLQGLNNLYRFASKQPIWHQEPFHSVLKESMRVCGDLSSMINSILIAYETEDQQFAPEMEVTDLRKPAEQARERAFLIAEAKDIALSSALPDEPLLAVIDAEWLQHVLDNLLTNAIKFSEARTKVSLMAERRENEIVIEVIDEGPGIAENEVPNLFTKFFRGSNPPTAGEASTGLGLFIAKKMVQAMNGRISYERRLPKGSIFRLHFLCVQTDTKIPFVVEQA